MKKLTFILALLFTIFAIIGCSLDTILPANSSINIWRWTAPATNITDKPNTVITKTFWAQDIKTQTFYQLVADRLASNSVCEVWAERNRNVTSTTATAVANAYKEVYKKNMNAFGWQGDIPLTNGKTMEMNTMEYAHALATGYKDTKLTILLLDIQDGYENPSDPYVAGYFHAVNFYENKYSNFKSNVLDMIYLDTYPSVPDSAESNGTLAHEMQHLMNFVTTIVKSRTTVMDTWIDEGLSSAAEWIYSGKHPAGRWNYYNQDQSGLIKKGNNFFIWDNHDDNPYAILDDYATAYLFFQYLRLQSGNPDNIYFDIHTSKFSDYRAVTTANDINSAHKNNWPLLLRDWHTANYTNATTGLYGYKNEKDLKTVRATMAPSGTTSLSLYPGEGVYSKTTSAESLPSANGNIKYAGLSSSGSPSDSTSFADGARLTYNVNTNKGGTAETGSTTGVAPSIGISPTAVSGSAQIASNIFSGPFKVDIGYFNRRNGNSTDKFDISTLERVHINE